MLLPLFDRRFGVPGLRVPACVYMPYPLPLVPDFVSEGSWVDFRSFVAGVFACVRAQLSKMCDFLYRSPDSVTFGVVCVWKFEVVFTSLASLC